MSEFRVIDGMIGGQQIADNSAVLEHRLGLTIKAVDVGATDYGVGEFIYLKGLDSTVVGDCVVYSEDDYSTKRAVANDAGSIAFAMSPCVTGEYGWYQVKGKAVGQVKTGFADDTACYLTSTPGSLDDAVVAGDRVHGCISASDIDTPDTGLAELEINYPRTDDIAD